MPFGEELGAGIGPRTEALKYSFIGSDQTRKRFTGYEKDDETGLDFAEARMYQNRHGRFTAVDPLLASANAADPQTLNRYIYTGNNPVNYTDQSGLRWCRKIGGGSTATTFAEGSAPCEDGWEDADNSVVTITGGDWSKKKAKVGDVVILNPNGTVTVVEKSPEAMAIAQGQSVVSAIVEVSSQTAADAVAAAVTTQGSVSGTITPRGFLSLCVSDLPCADPGPPMVDLTPGASADEVLDAVQTGLELIGLIPGLEPADAVSGIISLARGDNEGFALSVASMVPVAGIGAGVTKIGRRIDKAVDSIDSASDVAKSGRTGAQSRLKEIADDPKASSADRGWIKQEMNAIQRGKRDTIRRPPGKVLAHERGREAAKGFSYKHSKLQEKRLHDTQHKYDNFGRKNKIRP